MDPDIMPDNSTWGIPERLREHTVRNAYGEKVLMHGPVCQKCHQRITLMDARFPQQNSEPNICWHCN